MNTTFKDGTPRKTRGAHKKTTATFSFEPVFENEYIIQDMLAQLNKFCNQLVQCDLQNLCPASVSGTLTVKLQEKDITKQQILDAFNQPCEDSPEVMEEVTRIIRGNTKI